MTSAFGTFLRMPSKIVTVDVGVPLYSPHSIILSAALAPTTAIGLLSLRKGRVWFAFFNNVMDCRATSHDCCRSFAEATRSYDWGLHGTRPSGSSGPSSTETVQAQR